MNVSDAFYDHLLKKASKCLKKKNEKKKSCSRKECLSVFFFTTFPSLRFPSFFPFSEGGSIYCILSVG